MKYVVECPYCEYSYIINAREDEKDFQCENCGGQNGINDVVERIDDPIVVEKEVVKTVVVEKEVIKEVIKEVVVKEEDKPIVVDPDLQAIKSFDISEYPAREDYEYVDESFGKEMLRFVVLPFVIIGLIILFLISTVEPPEKMSERESLQRRVDEILFDTRKIE